MDRKTASVLEELGGEGSVDLATCEVTSAVIADNAWALGDDAPSFAVIGGLTVTGELVIDGYRDSPHIDVPAAVREAIQ